MRSRRRSRFGILALLCALAGSAAALRAADLSHTFSADDEFRIQIASDPQISPDGKRVAYVRAFADPMTDKRYANLWIVGSDGSEEDEREEQRHQNLAKRRSGFSNCAEAVVRISPAQIKVHTPPSR